jgi:GYF domain 2
MQKHQFVGEAGARVPSWYLRRGDKQYGPFGNRELLLLVERGRLRTDDLLWKQGFSTWKSLHAVCDLKTSPEGTSRKVASDQKASIPVVPNQDASYVPDGLTDDSPRKVEMGEALNVSQPRWLRINAKLYDEFRKFLMIFAYLWLVFFVFLVHEWVVLADNHIGFRFTALQPSMPWSFPRSC